MEVTKSELFQEMRWPFASGDKIAGRGSYSALINGLALKTADLIARLMKEVQLYRVSSDA